MQEKMYEKLYSHIRNFESVDSTAEIRFNRAFN